MRTLFLCLFSLNAYSSTKITECGLHDIYGEFRKNERSKTYELIVNGGTVSQYTFEINDEQERKITPYIGHSIRMRASLDSVAAEYKGKIDKIESIDFSVPDPAQLRGRGGFTLIKKEKCH